MQRVQHVPSEPEQPPPGTKSLQQSTAPVPSLQGWVLAAEADASAKSGVALAVGLMDELDDLPEQPTPIAQIQTRQARIERPSIPWEYHETLPGEHH